MSGFLKTIRDEKYPKGYVIARSPRFVHRCAGGITAVTTKRAQFPVDLFITHLSTPEKPRHTSQGPGSLD